LLCQDKDNMMQQVKDAGVAGIISYVFWEWAFWGVSVPVCIFGYREVRQHTYLALVKSHISPGWGGG